MESYNLLKRVVKDSVTEKDGTSFDPIKILGSFGILVFLGLSIYTVILNPASFNYMNWGIGFGSVLGAIAGSVKLKESTEQFVPGQGETQAEEKMK